MKREAVFGGIPQRNLPKANDVFTDRRLLWIALTELVDAIDRTTMNHLQYRSIRNQLAAARRAIGKITP